MITPNPSFRASPTLSDIVTKLAPLTDLIGRWVGKGFNLISLPNKDDDLGFRMQLNGTWEFLEFMPIGGFIPNRSSRQPDLIFAGLNYIQQISDSGTNGALHVEMGQWLNIPGTDVPPAGPSIVRQATILHGDALLAQGTRSDQNGAPTFPILDASPKGARVTPDYLKRFDSPDPTSLPSGIKPSYVKNPNLFLDDFVQQQRSLKGQTIINAVLLTLSTSIPGDPPIEGIINIPFLVKNANPTKLEAIFWIETVKDQSGLEFMQLQYSQTVILNFDEIDWPHISVANLIKQ